MNAILQARAADYAPVLLLQIVAAKIATTAVCRGSGLVGGIYAPSIFIGTLAKPLRVTVLPCALCIITMKQPHMRCNGLSRGGAGIRVWRPGGGGMHALGVAGGSPAAVCAGGCCWHVGRQLPGAPAVAAIRLLSLEVAKPGACIANVISSACAGVRVGCCCRRFRSQQCYFFSN